MSASPLDPLALPTDPAERYRLSRELMQACRQAMQRGELLVASLRVCDALMIDPNDREILDLFDDMALSQPDPLALFPVATGAIHVATAAGRARVLMMQRRLPEALELMGAIFEVAPDLAYFDWVRRWLSTPVAAELPWALLNDTVFVPTFRMVLKVPVPIDPHDPRLSNLQAAVEILRALSQLHAGQAPVHAAWSIALRRVPDPNGALQVASAAAARFPDSWQLQAACMNALCDLGRPDDALTHAREAVRLDPDDGSPLHDVAHAFLAIEQNQKALDLFQEVAAKDANYPGIEACLHYARFRTFGNPAERSALLTLRDRRPWDADVGRLASRLDPPVDYVTVLPAPMDAAAHYARDLLEEIRGVMACCGNGASLELSVQSEYAESPSAQLAFDVAMRALGAQSATMNVETQKVQTPDPRADKGPVPMPVWRYDGRAVTKVHPACNDPRAQQAVGNVAYQPFSKEAWDAAARNVALSAGTGAASAILSAVTNPPPPPPEFDGITWTYRCQIAAAAILSHMGPWESGPGRAALYSLVSGPSDWTTIAGVIALSWRAGDAPAVRAEIEGAFQWLRAQIPREGFTPWEHALIGTWLAMGQHAPERERDLETWQYEFERTVGSKNSVRTQRKYGGFTLDEYATFIVERDRAAKTQYGMGQAMAAPSPALVQLCQRYRLDPNRPYVPEWQEALNADPHLMQQFIDAKQALELQAAGVSGQEKAALDQIRAGEMDMHLRMAQAQEAQRTASDGDPDPLVFPGQAVARLSDYVRIMKGMQGGNMQGALAPYGLDMMSYGGVAQAWGAKMAADPVLSEKFSRMMNS